MITSIEIILNIFAIMYLSDNIFSYICWIIYLLFCLNLYAFFFYSQILLRQLRCITGNFYTTQKILMAIQWRSKDQEDLSLPRDGEFLQIEKNLRCRDRKRWPSRLSVREIEWLDKWSLLEINRPVDLPNGCGGVNGEEKSILYYYIS